MRFLFSLFLLFCSLSFINGRLDHSSPPRIKEGEKCYGLALSGGGDKGAYEAGAFQGLVENLLSSEIKYNVVTGISAGSLVAMGLSTFSIGDELAASDYMINIAINLTQSDIFTEWPGGIVAGLLEKSSLFDTTPLRKTVSKVMERGLKNRRLLIGATDIYDGTLKIWSENDNIIDAVMASSAIPGVFPPQTIGGRTYMDGGVRYGVNVFDAIVQCQELGASDDNIIIDIIGCYNFTIAPPSISPDQMKTIDILLRSQQMTSLDLHLNAVDEAKQSFPDVNFRFELLPSVPIPGSGIDFNRQEMIKMTQLGYQDAVYAINQWKKNKKNNNKNKNKIVEQE